jgi:hypothetical protein
VLRAAGILGLFEARLLITVSHSQQAAEPEDQANAEALKEQSSFVTYVHDYICDFIKFADQKAAFIFAGASAFLALVYNQGGRTIWHMPVSSWRAHEWLAGATIVLTVSSALLAVLAVAPKLTGARRGLIYWGSISAFSNPQDYSLALTKLDSRRAVDEMSRHCYELSRITKKKYQLINWSIWIGIAGLTLGGAYLLFF